MISDNRWLTYSEYLSVELQQSAEEGKDVDKYQEEVNRILELPEYTKERESRALKLLEEIERLPIREDYYYREPDDLGDIRKLRNCDGGKTYPFDSNILKDKVHGAWMGRCIGCLLGQPIEGWDHKRIEGYLKDTGNYPVKTYFSSQWPEEIIKRYQISNNGENAFCDTITHWINNVTVMTEDDDTNYTVIGLKMMEIYGKEFTSDHVASVWMDSLPIVHVSTAERVAYRNIVNLIEPPRSGWWKNPYREWIGAQIRGDIFGYVSPGNPEMAAELAWRDARISHVKNGIYGEMFIAAMLAAAYSMKRPLDVIQTGMAEIPETCRLYKKLTEVLDLYYSKQSFDEVLKWLHQEFDEKDAHSWCHTITNAVVVTISLLYGDGDFEKSIGLSMLCGFDTDCNGATVGSIVGLLTGYSGLPEHWIEPVGDLLNTGVSRFAQVSIKDMAERTLKLI